MIIALRKEGYQHRDDEAVDAFAAAMKIKLAAARERGRSGWDNTDEDGEGCSVDFLRRLLREHVDKGDPIDVANIAMFLWHRRAGTKP